MKENREPFCRHERIGADGLCLDCHKRAAISLDIPRNTATPKPSHDSASGELQSRVDCLAMFVRRMLRVMSVNGLSDRDVYRQAQIYLKSIGATGSILRDEDIQEQS